MQNYSIVLQVSTQMWRVTSACVDWLKQVMWPCLMSVLQEYTLPTERGTRKGPCSGGWRIFWTNNTICHMFNSLISASVFCNGPLWLAQALTGPNVAWHFSASVHCHLTRVSLHIFSFRERIWLAQLMSGNDWWLSGPWSHPLGEVDVEA